MKRMTALVPLLTLLTFGAVAAIAPGCGTSTLGTGATQIQSDVPHEANPAVSTDEYTAFVGGTNDFGFDLFKQLPGADKNLAFSPTSTAFALAMTYAGAKGTTEAQMASVLHNTLPQTAYHAAINKLTMDLAARNMPPTSDGMGNTSQIELSLANAIWAQTGKSFLAPYLDTLSINYDAGVHVLDFAGAAEASRSTINTWVADKTKNRIQDLLPSGSITPITALVLTNALYLNANWAERFDKTATAIKPFHLETGTDVSAPLMARRLDLPYVEGSDYQATELPYIGNKLAMTLILPAAGHFTEVRAGLSTAWLTTVVQGMSTSTASVSLTLPRFNFSWGTESLKPALMTLGMTDAFGPADFSGIDGDTDLYIDDVYHKAFLSVDEVGTEAAAATAVNAQRASVDPNPAKTFTADHAFLFLIRDRESGAVMFVGQVLDPTL